MCGGQGTRAETRRRETSPTPEDRKAELGIESFLLDCDGLLFAVGLGKAAEPDPWDERAEMLREQGLRMLGDGPGAKLDDPLRIRLAHVEADRVRVREAVDRIAEAALQRRSETFMALGRLVRRLYREAKSDPVDVEEWAALRDRAEALRGEPGLSPSVERAVRWVRERDARARAETRPVAAFLETGGAHLAAAGSNRGDGPLAGHRAGVAGGNGGLAGRLRRYPRRRAAPAWRDRRR